MRDIYKFLMLGLITTLFFACDDEDLFKTVEAPEPTVTATDWNATALDAGGNTVVSTGFAEGGRLFRLPSPINDTTSTTYRDINFSAIFNSGDERSIASVIIELSWIPSFPSNAAQSWTAYDTLTIETPEQSPVYNLDYTLNLNDWLDDYICFNFITGVPGGCGALGGDFSNAGSVFGLNIIREDNVMRFTLQFDDGTSERLAQVQFGYPLTEEGLL